MSDKLIYIIIVLLVAVFGILIYTLLQIGKLKKLLKARSWKKSSER